MHAIMEVNAAVAVLFKHLFPVPNGPRPTVARILNGAQDVSSLAEEENVSHQTVYPVGLQDLVKVGASQVW